MCAKSTVASKTADAHLIQAHTGADIAQGGACGNPQQKVPHSEQVQGKICVQVRNVPVALAQRIGGKQTTGACKGLRNVLVESVTAPE